MRNEGGFSLLMVLILTLLLTVLGLGLTMTSLSEFSMSNEFEAHTRALMTADAGFIQSANLLRGQDLDTLLTRETLVPVYWTGQTASSLLLGRNPILPIDARNVSFASPPAVAGTVRASGVLSPAGGVVIGTSRFFSRLADNVNSAAFPFEDNDPLTDADGAVFLRVVGVSRELPGETTSYSTNVKNSVAVVEGLLKQDVVFRVSSPFTVYGPYATPAQNSFFDGNSFTIDGYDHSGLTREQILRGRHNHNSASAGGAGVSVIYDDPASHDAMTSANVIKNRMMEGQYDNIEGQPGEFGASPSIREDTDLVRNDPLPDAENIFDPEWLDDFLTRLATAADNRYPDGTTLGGNNIVLGTDERPQITYVDGDLNLNGTGTGSGLLVVRGSLVYQGAFDFNGFILVVGEGDVDVGGANKSVIGGLYVSKLEGEDGELEFGAPSFTLSGQSNFYFRGDSIRMAMSLVPYRVLAWREVTPEIEPLPVKTTVTIGDTGGEVITGIGDVLTQ